MILLLILLTSVPALGAEDATGVAQDAAGVAERLDGGILRGNGACLRGDCVRKVVLLLCILMGLGREGLFCSTPPSDVGFSTPLHLHPLPRLCHGGLLAFGERLPNAI